MCSVQLKSRAAVKSRKTNNAIHKTTSESIRLDNPELLLNNNNTFFDGTTAVSLSPTNKKDNSPTSSFQITGVSLTRHDVGDDSADESHTDDISRITDNETPSFSEDTCSRDAEDNTSISGVYNTVYSTTHCLTTSSSDLSVTSSRLGSINVYNCIAETLSKATKTTLSSNSDTDKAVTTSINRFPGTRFKVVKIESRQPYRRGRWTCMDYSDNTNVPKINVASNLPITSTDLNLTYSPSSHTVATTTNSLDSNKTLSTSFIWKNKQMNHETMQSKFIGIDVSSLHGIQNGTEPVATSNVPYSTQSHKLNFVKLAPKEYDSELQRQSATLTSAFSKHLIHSTKKAFDDFQLRIDNSVACSITSPMLKLSSDALNGSTMESVTNSFCTSFTSESVVSEKNLRSLVSAVASLTRYNLEEVDVLSSANEVKLTNDISTTSSTSSLAPLDPHLDNKILQMSHAIQKLADSGEISHTEAASNTSAIIDTKIEQAMDLVKNHLMYTVREEVEVLKVRIAELLNHISQLEMENHLLKATATSETLDALHHRSKAVLSQLDKSIASGTTNAVPTNFI